MSFGLPSLPPVSRLSPRVWRVLGLNPGPYTLQGSNTYLVGSGESRVLVDTGAGAAGYLPALLACMAEAQCARISSVLVTHWHHDHTGGLPELLRHFGRAVPVFKHHPHSRGAAPASLVFEPITPHSRWAVEGATLTPVFTPGHTADHCAFVLEEEHAVFTGDCVLGHGTTVFRHLYDYTRSLHELDAISAARFYCGHGDTVLDPGEKIREYLRHRAQREQQLFTAVSQQSQPVDAHRLVSLVYPPLSASVLPAALQNVVLQLEKLAHEGKLVCLDEEERGTVAGDWLARDYGESCESTQAMVLRKAQWRWQVI